MAEEEWNYRMNDLTERLEYWLERITLYSDLAYLEPSFIKLELEELILLAKREQRIHESNLNFLAGVIHEHERD